MAKTSAWTVVENTHAEHLANPKIYDPPFALSPTDTADAGKHKLCNGIDHYTALPFIEDASGGGITALTGDVTASGSGSVAATIAADAVENSMLEDMPTSAVIGRLSPGVGDPQYLDIATDLKTALGLANAVTSSAPLYMFTYGPSSSGGMLTIDASNEFSAVTNAIISSPDNGVKFMLGQLDASSVNAVHQHIYDETGSGIGDGVNFNVTIIGTAA